MKIQLRLATRVGMILLAVLWACSGSALAGVYAIIIGVSDYEEPDLRDLPFVQMDVEAVRRVIESFAGPEVRIVDLHGAQLSANLKPTKANIIGALEKAAREATADDVLIFYFGGHGHAADETVYLVPQDGQLDRIAASMVPAATVRQHLASSSARHKIVLLDSCHSGAAASNGKFQPVDAEKVARSLEPAANRDQTVYTMTSCSADEESYTLLLDPSKPSVFTYWLEHALRGNANTNLDDVLDGQEVFSFVQTQVTRSSSHFKQQTPKLLTSNSDITRLPILWSIQPRSFRAVAQDTVKTMTPDLVYANAKRVGLIPFFQGASVKDASYSSDFALVCRQWAADAVHEFTTHAQSLDLPLSYLGENALDQTLRELEFSPFHVESAEMIRRLAAREQLDAIVSGQILVADPKEFTFSLVAFSADGKRLSDPIVAKGVVAADQVALLRSVDARNSSQQAKEEAIRRADEVSGPDITTQLKLKEDQLLAEALAKQIGDKSESHPLQDPAWPFRVSLTVNGQSPAPIFRQGQCFTPVKEGESFVVRVENHSGQMVMMRLLVDGFHTLPTLDTQETLSARRLEDARAWVLDPGKTYLIPGFVMELGGSEQLSKVREFEVVDASGSLARQRNYTKQLGVVTAVFYTAKNATRGVGVRPGKQSRVAIGRRQGLVPDRLLGSVHIRYFDPKYGQPGDSQPPIAK